ncbi:MAG: hypothetical protein RLZZ230_563 [Candidatus Parcubacteria bacterium]
MKTNKCEIYAVGKNRQGNVRYWCREHQAPAYKGSERLDHCIAANTPIISEQEILRITPAEFAGGVAFWGAVPPIYDTTRYPIDLGIHVHARLVKDGKKVIDKTYKRVIFENNDSKQSSIDTLSAVYYMVSLIFHKVMKVAPCNHCGSLHLDKDWFSVHEHKKHLCSSCGREFYDTGPGIGNPLMAIKQLCGDKEIFRSTVPAKKKRININQTDYPGGIRIWGSNQAIVWTAPKAEESGIHVHGYANNGAIIVDDTFQEVIVDNISLDANEVRIWMAQSAMPHLSDRFTTLSCPHCDKFHCDVDELAYTPHRLHHCEHCKHEFITPGRRKLVISNPMYEIVKILSKNAPRSPQINHGFLRPEV